MAHSQQRPPRTQQEAGGTETLRGGPMGQEKANQLLASLHCLPARARKHTHTQSTNLFVYF